MKIGFACGVFDLFHAGHVYMLMECKEQCDHLIIAVNTCENISTAINPGKEKPVFSLEHRILILESCRYVDEVLTYSSEDELLTLLKSRKIDIRFLGEDYKGKAITGAELNIPLYYTDRGHRLSTSYFKKCIRNS